MSATGQGKTGIKPEILAAITAALALYGYPAGGYQISHVNKCDNLWKKAGIMELMLGPEINRDFLLSMTKGSNLS